jgi:hypothetical protein
MLSLPLVNAVWYWRVQALKTNGSSGWSASLHFTTLASAVTSSPLFSNKSFSVVLSANVLRYTLPQGCMVQARLYDLRGRLTATLVESYVETGSHVATLPSLLPSGRYLLSFKAGSNSIDRSIVLLK